MAKKDDDKNDESEDRDFDFFWETDKNPVEEIDRMQSQMNDLMKHMWEDMFSGRGPMMKRTFSNFPIDVSETEEDIIVRANLPGIKKENVSVNATVTNLEIKADQHEEERQEGEDYFRQERRIGSFRRRLNLPAEVDPDGAEAEMEDGVLEVRLPKTERQSREIKPD